MKFMYYPKCSTCKKALKLLESLNLEFEKRDMIVDKLSYDEIKEIYEKSVLDIKKFFNTSGVLYRENNIKEKLENMSLEEKLKLLASDGKYVKRPILINENSVIIGFKEEEYLKLK